MIRAVFTAAASAAMLLGATAGAAAPGPAQRLDALLAQTKTLTAHFTETVENANAATVKHAEGTLAISKPGRFRWDYLKPYKQLIIADGDKLWVYDPGLQQVTVRPEPQALAAGPASLLAGSGKVEAQFDVTDEGTKRGLHWLKLVPHSDSTDYSAIRIGLADSGGIRAMDLKSHLGQTTHLEFKNVKRNGPVDASQFRFTPPEGVDVVHQPAARTRVPPAATGAS